MSLDMTTVVWDCHVETTIISSLPAFCSNHPAASGTVFYGVLPTSKDKAFAFRAEIPG